MSSQLSKIRPGTGIDRGNNPSSLALLKEKGRCQRFWKLLPDLSGDDLFKGMLGTVNNNVLLFKANFSQPSA